MDNAKSQLMAGDTETKDGRNLAGFLLGGLASTPSHSANRRNLTQDTLDVVLPLFVGGIIYLSWRETNLRMFVWANNLGLSQAIATLRAEFGAWKLFVPGYVVYSLPDALWTYSFARFHYVLYARGNSAAWLAVAPVLAIGSEVGQALGIVPGTFDWCDLLFCSGAALLAFRPRRTR